MRAYTLWYVDTDLRYNHGVDAFSCKTFKQECIPVWAAPVDRILTHACENITSFADGKEVAALLWSFKFNLTVDKCYLEHCTNAADILTTVLYKVLLD